jgi:hypothetical protein
MSKPVILAIITCLAAFSADMAGTWKLNTAKSKYTNMLAPRERQVSVTPSNDGGLQYEFRGAYVDGNAANASVSQPKDVVPGRALKTTGFSLFDAVVPLNAEATKATIMRGGKPVGTITRTFSADGRVMTVRGRLTKPDGTRASYVSVYEKQ